ncbi:MAG: helix-turn-helix domain-containing protein [Candidatus ainarchaeum sp.]|nr:helix-turn-helix domain-containing protein [Candidatus ainarchaeum sp.]
MIVLKKKEEILPLEKALLLVGKKFDLLIINSINKNGGRSRFNQIINDIKTINPRILSMRLKDFEKNGLLSKSIILGTPVKTEYALTKKSKDLIEIIEKLDNWAK